MTRALKLFDGGDHYIVVRRLDLRRSQTQFSALAVPPLRAHAVGARLLARNSTRALVQWRRMLGVEACSLERFARRALADLRAPNSRLVLLVPHRQRSARLYTGAKLAPLEPELGESPQADIAEEFVSITIQFVVDGEPRKNEDYELEIDGAPFSTGQTDAEGIVSETEVPAAAKTGRLIFNPGAPEEEAFELLIGALEPAAQTTGAQARLNQLGYMCGAVDGDLADFTKGALRAFQADWGLDPTGLLCSTTQAKLEEIHGS